MTKAGLNRSLGILCALALCSSITTAQSGGAEDAAIDQIRRLSNIGPIDQESIRNWIQVQVDTLAQASPSVGGLHGAAFQSFRQRFVDQYANGANTPEFRVQFATQVATRAAAEFGKRDLKPTVGWGLAQAMLDMPRQSETIPGYLAGLNAGVPLVRYLSVQGLMQQQSAIKGDANRLQGVLQAVGAAALAETSGPALGRMYEALAIAGQPAAVFDAYLAVFDKRIAARRADPGKTNGAELSAWEYFRNGQVLAALDANQRAELVRRVAVFLRLDVDRYNDPSIAPPASTSAPDLLAPERASLERCIDAEEDILKQVVGDGGGAIRDAFSDGGYQLRSEVQRQAYRWVGNPSANESGVLNAAPWNVEIGAP